ncbi:hypothetical protein P0W64_12320 [Tsukamurella sp. 8F]|uniref:hypothetical protein n=1 Tax=unclassified Tsukamurella TaxID=2633480 RepID=UPI0023B8F7C9|nr:MULTISPECIES: hypothetical protein [unclassified Tsukamurella]MDF0531593.1 hypothetical protein [Tsukamurella sp. 8J]MDF0587560.1 hypothetical protein [Tsukamurella sp. 8F]
MTRTTSSLRGTVGAFALLAAAAVVYLLAIGTYAGQVTDQAAMTAMSSMFGVDSPTAGILDEIQVPLLATAAAGLGVACLHRRSLRLVVHVSVAVIGSIAGAILLKYGLIRPELGVGPQVNSFPSNTVAAFAGVALAFIAAVPRSARGCTAVLGGLTVGVVSAGVVALQWHRPSDVLGGLLIAGAAAAAGQGMASVMPARRRRAKRMATAPDRTTVSAG